MMNSTTDDGSREVLENEIADLEFRLRRAKERLAKSETATISPSPSAQSAHHYLLLLSDSALPLGSFAFSSGLESYLAHTRRVRTSPSSYSSSSSILFSSSFTSFLPLSLSSYASSTLPFALAAHRDPEPGHVAALDDALDAAIVCTVGRRASIAQGRALLSIWEKSVAATADPGARLRPFADMLRSSSSNPNSANGNGSGNGSAKGKGRGGDGPPLVSAHLAPLFGAVAALCGLSLRQTAYVFMLSHVKALVSAAVRAGQFGPYQAQRILASAEVQAYLEAAIEREWRTPVEAAGQSVPVMDLWFGRHELLYSRIFNS